ncbi:MAG: polysaccharide pyruvyl transferase family protein [Bacilli bacterium]|nr:polysaccharide pyruvyl transferase family protein [Bacilli bacterium]
MIIKKIWKRIARYPSIIKHSKNVLKSIKNEKYIFYFGVPMHPNLGDLAQCVCIRKFLKENYSDYDVIEIDTNAFLSRFTTLRKKLKSKIKDTDLIFFQSGYCTHDLGGREDLMHQAVIKDYPNNRIIVLPQTVFFKSDCRKKQASEVYNSHKHILFLARDNVSYKLAKEMFPDIEIKAFPDIVTTMIGNYSFNNDRNGVLICVRNDIEKYYTDSDIENLKNIIERNTSVTVTDTTITKKIDANYNGLEKYILDYINDFSKYKVIITDRYHGTIFSLIANTPVIVIKSTDHKVKTGVDWFEGVYDDNIFYIDDINDVPNKVNELLKRKKIEKNKPYFKEKYYDKLPEFINKLK